MPFGIMIYYRRKESNDSYKFGFTSYVNGNPNLVRLGRWNGDYDGGPVVHPYDIEWYKYNG